MEESVADYKFVVFTNCHPGTDEAFNRWYDEEHIADLLAVPGFVSASRMRVVPQDGEQPTHRYLAIYDLRTDDVHGALAEMMSRAGTEQMGLSPTLVDDAKTTLWEVITPLRSA
jgi:hypothetical protein